MDLLSDQTVKLQIYHKMCRASTVASFSKGCRNREAVSLLLSSGELRTKQLKLLNTGMCQLSDMQIICKELDKLLLSNRRIQIKLHPSNAHSEPKIESENRNLL